MRRAALPTQWHAGGISGWADMRCEHLGLTWACLGFVPVGLHAGIGGRVCSAGMHSRGQDKTQHVPALSWRRHTQQPITPGSSAWWWEGKADKAVGTPRCPDL